MVGGKLDVETLELAGGAQAVPRRAPGYGPRAVKGMTI